MFDSLVTSVTDNNCLAQENAFAVPASDPFDASLSDFWEFPDNFQDGSFGQFDFSSLTNSENPSIVDFDPLFDVDAASWNEVFGETDSQGSIFSSLWDLTAKPTDDEFLRRILEALESTPAGVSRFFF